MMIIINDDNREYAEAPASKWVLSLQASVYRISSYDIRAVHTLQAAQNMAQDMNIPVEAVIAVANKMREVAREWQCDAPWQSDCVIEVMIMRDLLPKCRFPGFLDYHSNLYAFYAFLAFYAVDSVIRRNVHEFYTI